MSSLASLVTAVVLVVAGLALVAGLFDWIVRLTGLALIAWGIVLGIIAVGSGGRRRSR